MIWSQWVFIAMSILSLPLYLLTIIVCVKEWKQNHLRRTFYLLLISQGVVDIIVVINYFLFWTIRLLQINNDFYWNLRYTYLPTWSFIQNYISVNIRCFGVLLITFQRYLSMCRNRTRIEQFVNITHRWILPIVQWTIPLLYSIPLYTIKNVTYDCYENLEIIAEQNDMMLATSMTASFTCVTFILCSFCYGTILKFLLNNKHNSSMAIKTEYRLYIQILGLFVAFALIFVYFVVMFFLSIRSDHGAMYTLRIIFPIVNCILSYVNVWMMLILNSDIRKKVWNFVYC